MTHLLYLIFIESADNLDEIAAKRIHIFQIRFNTFINRK